MVVIYIGKGRRFACPAASLQHRAESHPEIGLGPQDDDIYASNCGVYLYAMAGPPNLYNYTVTR
ncbi:MAG: hypothetical protein ACYCPD_06255 [Acidobacteriaceae bacterium]